MKVFPTMKVSRIEKLIVVIVEGLFFTVWRCYVCSRSEVAVRTMQGPFNRPDEGYTG
jgi:hypothetical protein